MLESTPDKAVNYIGLRWFVTLGKRYILVKWKQNEKKGVDWK